VKGGHLVLKQGHLEVVAQGHVQVAFEDLQGWRCHNFSGQKMHCVSIKTRKLSICQKGKLLSKTYMKRNLRNISQIYDDKKVLFKK